MPKINFAAVLAAAVASFIVGGLWYSLIFKSAWMRANGFSEEELSKRNPAVMFGVSFLLSLVMAFNLAAFLGNEGVSLTWGMTAGALAGAGWVAAALAVTAVFERRGWLYVAINGGYWIAAFVVMGGIIGAWR
jgi:hypothetical protein